jgi:hypothetical protein
MISQTTWLVGLFVADFLSLCWLMDLFCEPYDLFMAGS